MAQYIYLQQDESSSLLNDNNVQILNSPQQVMTSTGDGNVYVYHQTPTQATQGIPYQQQQQHTPPQQQQWVQSIPTGQVIYTSPQPQQQQQQQSPMNVIVQPVNMNQQRPTYMKVVTVNAQQQQQLQAQQQMHQPVMVARPQVRPQMMPVILNSGYRPTQIQPVSQSVIIQNPPPPLRPSNIQSQQQQQQQQPQQVIIDPRAFIQMQQANSGQAVTSQASATGGTPARPPTTLQYRLIQAKANSTPTTRFTRPVNSTQVGQQQQRTVILNNRAPIPRAAATAGTPGVRGPPLKMVRGPGGMQSIRIVRPQGNQTRVVRPVTSAAGAPRSQLVKQPVQRATSSIIRKTNPTVNVPQNTPVRSYSPQVVRQPTQPVARTPPTTPQPSWKPVVEVRPPGPDSRSDDDIENALSTAILHRNQPQHASDFFNRPPPGPSHQQPQQQQQQQQQPRPPHKGPPGSVDISSVMHTDVINTQSSCETAKMLVILPDEERRLITFTLPSESCTVVELLEQVGIELTPHMSVHCAAIADEGLDYVVTITENKPLPPPPPQINTHVIHMNVMAQSGMQQQMHQPQQQRQKVVHQRRPMQIQQQQPVQPEAPPAPPHVPKYVEGFWAICESCGFLSMDHSKCERCARVLSSPQTKPVRPPPATPTPSAATASSSQHVMQMQMQMQSTPKIVLTRLSPIKAPNSLPAKLKRGGIAGRTPSLRGRGAAMSAGTAGKGRGVSRVKKVEEPVVLTLSSDEEEEEEGTSKPPKRYPFEPEYADEGAAGDSVSTDISDSDRVDVCSQIGQPASLNTTLECKELRFGSYVASTEPANTLMVAITHLGIKFVFQHGPDKLPIALHIDDKEIMKFVVHFGNQLPVIFLYTTPGCGRYIRRKLQMGQVLGAQDGNQPLPAFFDPSNCTEQVKRIVLVAKGPVRDDVKNTIKMIYPRIKYDEITYRDAMDLLKKSRGAKDGDGNGGSSTHNTYGGLPKRSSAMVAMATIKKYANVEQEMRAGTPGRGGTQSGDFALSQGTESGQDIHKLMIYPPQGKGGISINTEDYQCLAVDQYLNDVIIDFYLKYLHDEVMTPEQGSKTHIFSSFFYKRLTATSARQRHLEKDLKMTPAQKRHNRVKSWTKNVNLFEKDFIIIPINELSHWFLAIICFPGLDRARSTKTGQEMPAPNSKGGASSQKSGLTKQAVKEMEKRKSGLMSVTIGNTTITPVGKREENNIYVNEETLSERDEAEGEDSDMMMTEDEDEEEAPKMSQEQLKDPLQQPCILVFDSLRGTARSRVTATLREYLTCEYAARRAEKAPEKVFDKNQMPGHNAKVPQQNNFTDCGLFVLQYVEEMIKTPIADFRLPIKELKTWFNTQKVTRKREDIAMLIRKLLEKEHADRIPLLPEIDFPTVNGELVEPPKADTQPEASASQKRVDPIKTTGEEEDEGADSEDMFADLENTVVDERMEEEEQQQQNETNGSERKVTKLMIPSLSKRKNSLEPGQGPGSSSESQSLRKKTPRLSH